MIFPPLPRLMRQISRLMVAGVFVVASLLQTLPPGCCLAGGPAQEADRSVCCENGCSIEWESGRNNEQLPDKQCPVTTSSELPHVAFASSPDVSQPAPAKAARTSDALPPIFIITESSTRALRAPPARVGPRLHLQLQVFRC